MEHPTPAEAVRAAIDALRHATDEEIGATVLRVAADRLLPRPAREDQSPQAVRDRLLVLQFLETANTLAGNPPPAASQEALAEAREESQAAAIESTPDRLRHCPTHGQQGPEAWGCPECLRELRAELATTREALRRLVVWGGFAPFRHGSQGFDRETVLAVADWFADGMTGPLPPLPPYIASRQGLEPTTSAPALPPALVLDGGDGVRIEATNHERSSWAIRDGNWCLNFSGIWESEPYASSRDAGYLARARWPSVEAAWAALLDYRARGGGSEGPLDPDAMPLG